MISFTCSLMPPDSAITLWPFVVFGVRARLDPCTALHERYHWWHALRWGVLPWYVAYLALGLLELLGNRPFSSPDHPFERPAYAVEARCRQ